MSYSIFLCDILFAFIKGNVSHSLLQLWCRLFIFIIAITGGKKAYNSLLPMASESLLPIMYFFLIAKNSPISFELPFVVMNIYVDKITN